MTTELPVITSADDMLAHLVGLDEFIDGDTLTTAFARVGRNWAPAILRALFDLGQIPDPDVLAVGIEAAWTSAEFPMVQLTAREWADMFEEVGYLEGVERRFDLIPHKPLTLYRGATDAYRLGWSWTDDIDQARWFANRPIQHGAGRVFKAVVEPHRILAHFPDGRDENEYVVDATGMAIEVAS